MDGHQALCMSVTELRRPHDKAMQEMSVKIQTEGLMVKGAGHGDRDGGKMAKPKALPPKPGFLDSMQLLPTGSWLMKHEGRMEGLQDRVNQEVTNLGLILALLSTMYIPLYYGEVSRIGVPDDGYAVDVASSVLAPLKVGPDFLHDWTDISYITASCASFLGTVCAALLQLGVSECEGDEGVAVLLDTLGILRAFPYLCLNVSCLGWALGMWMHMVIVPRTIPGLVIKLAICTSMVLGGVGLMGRTVQGVFASAHDVAANPPRDVGEEEIEAALDKFFTERDGEMSLSEFLDSLRPAGTGTYRAPLTALTRTRASYHYHKKLAEVARVPLDFVLRPPNAAS